MNSQQKTSWVVRRLLFWVEVCWRFYHLWNGQFPSPDFHLIHLYEAQKNSDPRVLANRSVLVGVAVSARQTQRLNIIDQGISPSSLTKGNFDAEKVPRTKNIHRSCHHHLGWNLFWGGEC